jgi:hypothetical protein
MENSSIGIAIQMSELKKIVSQTMGVITSPEARREVAEMLSQLIHSATVISPAATVQDIDDFLSCFRAEEDDEFVDLNYVAARFGRDPRTISRWCRDGKFPGAVPPEGGRRRNGWRVPRAALRDFTPPKYSYKQEDSNE